MKNILVLNGNPKVGSFSQALAESYVSGAVHSGNSVSLVNIYDLEFDPILKGGYESEQVTEESLENLKQKITEASHVVVVFPVWWGSTPAALKGVLDRVFLPGFAFKYEKDDVLPKRLLKGRTARLIVTMDTPIWYDTLVYGAPATKMMKNAVLGFCGFKPVKVTKFGSMIKSKEEDRKKFVERVYDLGIGAV